MLISWKYKFLFVHIPKTGGTSLVRALLPYARTVDQLSRRALSVPGLRRLLVYGARSANPIEFYSGLSSHGVVKGAVDKFGEEKIKPLTRIAFVRNPFTHAYSMYSHARHYPHHPFHEEFRTIDFQEMLEKRYLQGYGAQLPYVRSFPEEACRLNFIGRFERLSDDTAQMAARIGLPGNFKLPRKNINPTPPVDLRAAFGSALERFIQAKADEFAYFGYPTDIERADEPPNLPPSEDIRRAAQWGDAKQR